MAQQTIGLGATANDGTGDPARTAFDKVNDNFDELYDTLTLSVAGFVGKDAAGLAAALTPAQAKTILAIAQADVAGLTTASSPTFANITLGATALLSGGKIDTSLMPSIAITDTFVVGSQAAMLALTAETGDIAIRTDQNKSYALSTNSPGTLADWKELLTPTDTVLSVAGLTGAISAGSLKTALSLAQADIAGLTTSDSPTFKGLTLAAGTITASAPATITQTWNSSGVTFNGLLLNVTDTASAAASLLADLQIGGTSKFKVDKAGAVTAAGQIVAPDGTSAAPGHSFGGHLTSGLYYISATGQLVLTTNGSPVFATNGDCSMIAAAKFGWTSVSTAVGFAIDTALYRDAAATLAQRNGATAQEQRWYNTYTDASNYERGSLGWTVNTNWLTLRSINAGTGTARGIVIDSATDIVAFKGITSSFPALKRSSTVLQARLADDSAFAPLQGKLRTDGNAVAETITPDHTIVITDASGQAYRVPCQV